MKDPLEHGVLCEYKSSERITVRLEEINGKYYVNHFMDFGGTEEDAVGAVCLKETFPFDLEELPLAYAQFQSVILRSLSKKI